MIWWWCWLQCNDGKSSRDEAQTVVSSHLIAPIALPSRSPVSEQIGKENEQSKRNQKFREFFTQHSSCIIWMPPGVPEMESPHYHKRQNKVTVLVWTPFDSLRPVSLLALICLKLKLLMLSDTDNLYQILKRYAVIRIVPSHVTYTIQFSKQTLSGIGCRVSKTNSDLILSDFHKP